MRNNTEGSVKRVCATVWKTDKPQNEFDIETTVSTGATPEELELALLREAMFVLGYGMSKPRSYK